MLMITLTNNTDYTHTYIYRYLSFQEIAYFIRKTRCFFFLFLFMQIFLTIYNQKFLVNDCNVFSRLSIYYIKYALIIFDKSIIKVIAFTTAFVHSPDLQNVLLTETFPLTEFLSGITLKDSANKIQNATVWQILWTYTNIYAQTYTCTINATRVIRKMCAFFFYQSIIT